MDPHSPPTYTPRSRLKVGSALCISLKTDIGPNSRLMSPVMLRTYNIFCYLALQVLFFLDGSQFLEEQARKWPPLSFPSKCTRHRARNISRGPSSGGAWPEDFDRRTDSGKARTKDKTSKPFSSRSVFAADQIKRGASLKFRYRVASVIQNLCPNRCPSWSPKIGVQAYSFEAMDSHNGHVVLRGHLYAAGPRHCELPLAAENILRSECLQLRRSRDTAAHRRDSNYNMVESLKSNVQSNTTLHLNVKNPHIDYSCRFQPFRRHRFGSRSSDGPTQYKISL